MKKPVMTLLAAALTAAAIAPAASADIIVLGSPLHVIEDDAKLTPLPEPRPLPFPFPVVLPMPRPFPLPDTCLSCPPMPLDHTPISRMVILR